MANKRKASQAVETSARDVLNGWNYYYVNNKFGLGIQCSLCYKWRLTYQYEESKDVPENWTCFQWDNGENEIGCHVESHLTEDYFAEEKYSPGTVVWAKLPGCQWWPAMVEDSPDTQDFFMTDENDEEVYHVTFFSQKPQRSWIKAQHILEFSDELPKPSKKLFKPTTTLRKSIKQAKEALKLPLKERLLKYSFAVRYNGRWAKFNDEDDVSLPPKCPSLKELANPADDVSLPPKCPSLKELAKPAEAKAPALNENHHSGNGNDRQTPTQHIRRRAFGAKKKSKAKREVVNEEDDKASVNQSDTTTKEPVSEKVKTMIVFPDLFEFKCYPCLQVYQISRGDLNDMEDQPCVCQNGKGRNKADGMKKEPEVETEQQITQSVDKVDGNAEPQPEENEASTVVKANPKDHADFANVYEIYLEQYYPSELN